MDETEVYRYSLSFAAGSREKNLLSYCFTAIKTVFSLIHYNTNLEFRQVVFLLP